VLTPILSSDDKGNLYPQDAIKIVTYDLVVQDHHPRLPFKVVIQGCHPRSSFKDVLFHPGQGHPNFEWSSD
jgi:hypothetical protein